MNILVIGDIFGKPGRRAIKELLPKIVEREKIDFVIANAENAAGGKGLSPKIADELFKYPIDVMTAGNHIWEFDAIHPYFDSHNILRPLNTKEKLPGRGWAIFESGGLKIAVVCMQGEIFMQEKGPQVTNPFKLMEELLPTLVTEADLTIIDFHAEATSEKRAFAWFLDGKVGAILGTHTHVQTADEEMMPGGTAYISDLGMTGPHASVIGLKKEIAIHRFVEGTKKGFKVAEGDVRLEGVVLSVDKNAKKVLSIKRVKESL
jgi:hypothetical protein